MAALLSPPIAVCTSVRRSLNGAMRDLAAVGGDQDGCISNGAGTLIG